MHVHVHVLNYPHSHGRFPARPLCGLVQVGRSNLQLAALPCRSLQLHQTPCYHFGSAGSIPDVLDAGAGNSIGNLVPDAIYFQLAASFVDQSMPFFSDILGHLRVAGSHDEWNYGVLLLVVSDHDGFWEVPMAVLFSPLYPGPQCICSPLPLVLIVYR